jgi:magnesium-transporting ATPase (P-type)
MRDLKKYKHETNIRMVIGAVLLLFLVGDGLIFIIYGSGPALMGLVCLIVGLVPILLIALVIKIFTWSVERANRE